MGNTCVGPNLGGGFLQSFTAAVWRNRPPEDRLPPPKSKEENSSKNGANSNHGSSKGSESDAPKAPPDQAPKAIEAPPNPVQSTPPVTVKINDDPPQKAEPEKPNKPEVKEEVSKPPDAEKQKKAHMKRISSVGLQVESVLGRKTGNIKDVYSLGRKLGQGQFGTTFLCVEKETNKEFACKSIAKRKLTTQEDVEDVRREIQIMHHLAGHPNVIQIISAYEDAVAVHVVMELCAGGELFDRIIQRGHYTERKAAKLARVIVGVLEACHSLGVMHRDLKPENFLFVDQDEEAPLKTIDFGLSVFFRPGMKPYSWKIELYSSTESIWKKLDLNFVARPYCHKYVKEIYAFASYYCWYLVVVEFTYYFFHFILFVYFDMCKVLDFILLQWLCGVGSAMFLLWLLLK